MAKVTSATVVTASVADLQAALASAKGKLHVEITRELAAREESLKAYYPDASLPTAPEFAQQMHAELPELLPAAPQTDATPPAVAAGPVLHVKQGLALRGGRGEWYKLLCQYNGRPVAEYIAAGKANPASHYTARSTKCGQPKTPESRLSWFKRAGIVTIA
jgi:hypothetical protein